MKRLLMKARVQTKIESIDVKSLLINNRKPYSCVFIVFDAISQLSKQGIYFRVKSR